MAPISTRTVVSHHLKNAWSPNTDLQQRPSCEYRLKAEWDSVVEGGCFCCRESNTFYSMKIFFQMFKSSNLTKDTDDWSLVSANDCLSESSSRLQLCAEFFSVSCACRIEGIKAGGAACTSKWDLPYTRSAFFHSLTTMVSITFTKETVRFTLIFHPVEGCPGAKNLSMNLYGMLWKMLKWGVCVQQRN